MEYSIKNYIVLPFLLFLYKARNIKFIFKF